MGESDLVYGLRTCKSDMTSHSGFVWPESGDVVAPDWNPKPECGNGLHMLLWGIGEFSLLLLSNPTAKWLVVEALASDVVDLGGKVKIPRGRVVYCGGLPGAQQLIAEKRLLYLAVKDGAAPASTTGYQAPASTTGYQAPASTTGYQAPASTTGANSVACCLGTDGQASVGRNGSLILTYWDGARYRHVVGYVGEDGIEANRTYKVEDGRLVAVAPVSSECVQ